MNVSGEPTAAESNSQFRFDHLWFDCSFWKRNCTLKSKIAWLLCMVTFPSMATVKNLLNEFRTSVLHKPLPGWKRRNHGGYLQSRITWPVFDVTRYSWDSRQRSRLRELHYAWNIGHKKAVDAISAAFAYSAQQAQPCDHFVTVWRTKFHINPTIFV